MAENYGRVSAENLLNNVMETLADSIPKSSPSTFFESSEKPSVSVTFNRLFGRQRPVHRILGGGQSADVLLWRNKRISGSVLAGATVIWLLFEWLNYHFLTLVCLALVLSMSALFLWSNAAVFINRSPPRMRPIALPKDIFVDAAIAFSDQINRFLGFLQEVAVGKDLKTFLAVSAGLWFLAIIGSWCNFLTVLYLACTQEEVNKIVDSSRVAQKEWANTPLWKQAKLLHRAAALLKEHKNPIAECLVKAIAKLAKDVVTEVVRSRDLISYCAEEEVRILCEGKLLVSDSFPGNDRNKFVLKAHMPLAPHAEDSDHQFDFSLKYLSRISVFLIPLYLEVLQSYVVGRRAMPSAH